MDKYTYQLYDSSGRIGEPIIISLSPKPFKQVLADYIKTDEEEYNMDDFFSYLKEKGYEVEQIIIEEEVYF